jgi:predicted CXXCH cytochrome family protein
MDYVHANDVCIQCHSQGRPVQNPIEGRYYDWPVGFQVGLNLRDYWKLETRQLGHTDFYYYADGTAHKNRMQGNDFSESLMYRRGVRCFNCHDVHGTENPFQLLRPANVLCLTCHGPESPNGPHAKTLEEHTHHKSGSPGDDCVSCHMPAIQTTIANVKVHSHTFEFITPAFTDRYGIPNPCTSCHQDKSTAWASEALHHWSDVSPWRLD